MIVERWEETAEVRREVAVAAVVVWCLDLATRPCEEEGLRRLLDDGGIGEVWRDGCDGPMIRQGRRRSACGEAGRWRDAGRRVRLELSWTRCAGDGQKVEVRICAYVITVCVCVISHDSRDGRDWDPDCTFLHSNDEDCGKCNFVSCSLVFGYAFVSYVSYTSVNLSASMDNSV